MRGTAKLDRKAVRRMLAEHGVGPVRVLARGLAESAEALAKSLRGPGSERGTLVAARCASGRRVWLVEEDGSHRNLTVSRGRSPRGAPQDGAPSPPP
ncbi:MAG: hypothetical protein R3F34_11625 [Planctomycetota bacterium]